MTELVGINAIDPMPACSRGGMDVEDDEADPG